MDTVEFRHHYLPQLGLTPTDCLIHALHTLAAAMHHTPSFNIKQQLLSINHLRCLFHTWRDTNSTTSSYPKDIPTLTPSAVTRPPQDSHVVKPSTHTQQLPETHTNLHVPRPI